MLRDWSRVVSQPLLFAEIVAGGVYMENERPLLPQKCERCGNRSRFPMAGVRKLKPSQRLTRTTKGNDLKLICVKCEKVLFKDELMSDPAIPKRINVWGELELDIGTIPISMKPDDKIRKKGEN